ncbi:fertility inhibition protein FinO [Klebsiella sp. WOUb02]|uniref:fertility inhibition protein FinO n=1 Tax=Klebsiella sp. WOUb02 TaxID=3161071 RepID=UPI003CF6843C
MSEEKRPVLSLKRKPAAETPASPEPDVARVVHRKKVITVTTPPAWKVKKAQLAKAKAAALPATPAPVAAETVKAPPPVRYLTLLPVEQAITTLKAFWPQLFEGDRPHLLATGTREALFADIENQALPLSHKQVLICLKSLTRADVYLSRMRTGAVRVDIHGNTVATVTAEEEAYARGRMAKQAQRQARTAGTHEHTV